MLLSSHNIVSYIFTSNILNPKVVPGAYFMGDVENTGKPGKEVARSDDNSMTILGL